MSPLWETTCSLRPYLDALLLRMPKSVPSFDISGVGQPTSDLTTGHEPSRLVFTRTRQQPYPLVEGSTISLPLRRAQ